MPPCRSQRKRRRHRRRHYTALRRHLYYLPTTLPRTHFPCRPQPCNSHHRRQHRRNGQTRLRIPKLRPRLYLRYQLFTRPSNHSHTIYRHHPTTPHPQTRNTHQRRRHRLQRTATLKHQLRRPRPKHTRRTTLHLYLYQARRYHRTLYQEDQSTNSKHLTTEL